MTEGRAVVGVFLLTVALAGCGGSNYVASPPATAVTSPTLPSTTTTTLVPATTIAAAINLLGADLPGFTASAHVTSQQDRQQSDQLAKCAGGVPPSSYVADIYSDDFASGSGANTHQVNSEVSELASTALVQQDLLALRSSKAQACFTQFLNQVVVQEAGGNVHFGNASVVPFPVNASGSGGSFGYHLSVTGSEGNVQLTVDLDEVGFTRHNYEISLTATTVGSPFPLATEQQLVSLLARRATAAIH